MVPVFVSAGLAFSFLFALVAWDGNAAITGNKPSFLNCSAGKDSATVCTIGDTTKPITLTMK
jgi:hypothetical protein